MPGQSNTDTDVPTIKVINRSRRLKKAVYIKDPQALKPCIHFPTTIVKFVEEPEKP